MTGGLEKFEALQTRADEGAWKEIEDPETGEPTGMHLKVLGEDSETYQKYLRKYRDKHLKRGTKALKWDNFETERTESLVACTVDWDGIKYQGQEIEFSKENVRWLYTTFRAIRDQVDEFMGDRANFSGE